MPQGEQTPERSIILPDLTKMKKRKKKKKASPSQSKVSTSSSVHVVSPQNPILPEPSSPMETHTEANAPAQRVSARSVEITSITEELEKTEIIPIAIEPLPILIGPKPIAQREKEEKTEDFNEKTDANTDPYPEMNDVTDQNEYDVTEKTDRMKLQVVQENPIVMVEEYTKELDVCEDPAREENRKEPNRMRIHQKELQHLLVFGFSFFLLGLIPYTTPALADYRPWEKGDPIPILSLLSPSQTVVEDEQGNLAVQIEEVVEPVEEIQAPIVVEETPPKISAIIDPPENRSPAVAQEISIPSGSMDHYFQRLYQIENGEDDIARALIWGDSTIAADGIVKNIRARMQERFGDGGPGFIPINLNSIWTMRKEILRKSSGWSTNNIVYGGASSKRYGLAGMVSSSSSKATTRLGGVKVDGVRQPLHRYQIFYQQQPKGGSFLADIRSDSITIDTQSEEISDGHIDLFSDEGVPEVNLSSNGDGVVTIYGVALETNGPGVTWETFGVAGASVSSMKNQGQEHLYSQISARDPALVVYWTGGNETGYPSLKSKTGKAYKRIYRKAILKLKHESIEASCLLIGPLDQGVRENGVIKSKKALRKLIQFQKEVAEEVGCAYWDAQAAMGGENSFSAWMKSKPKLAASDLSHLTRRGRSLIGETLSDMILYSYEKWKIQNPEGISNLSPGAIQESE
ncbi:MAG: hypothetical protein VX278_13735 [Myxococcota bacterium]|nr:hypothetical protein [Myxococcota bacterium]